MKKSHRFGGDTALMASRKQRSRKVNPITRAIIEEDQQKTVEGM